MTKDSVSVQIREAVKLPLDDSAKEAMTNRVDLYSAILAHFLVCSQEQQKIILAGGKVAKGLLEAGLDVPTAKDLIEREKVKTKDNEAKA